MMGRRLPSLRSVHPVTATEGFMEPYQERVVAEKRELDEKLKKLGEFIAGELFTALPPDERGRLITQRAAMAVYSGILGRRIEAFTGEPSLLPVAPPAPDIADQLRTAFELGRLYADLCTVRSLVNDSAEIRGRCLQQRDCDDIALISRIADNGISKVMQRIDELRSHTPDHADVVVRSTKGTREKFSQRELAMLVDAANRMIADDVWDQYSDADERAIESAAGKLAGLSLPGGGQ